MLQVPTWAVGSSDPPLKPLAKPDPIPKRDRKKAEPEEFPMEGDYAMVLDGVKTIQVPDEIVVLSSEANLCERDFIQLTSAALLAQLPREQRVLRTTFVREYLYDFDPLLAAIRVGFLNVRGEGERFSPAANAARALMAEPVVQRLIKECMLSVVNDEGLESVALTLVLREATNHGISGNAAARNNSFKLLLEAVERTRGKNQGGDEIRGNVMLIPPSSHEVAWEQTAMQSQKALKESVRA